jgi:uncharacterized protein (TIGR00369 family)
VSLADLSLMKGFDPKLFAGYASRVGHGAALGIRYHDHGRDWVELVLDHRDQLVGVVETGVIASGPIISLMDMALSMAIWTRLDCFRHQATLDMRIDYLRAATPGAAIIGHGECYSITRNVAFVRGHAYQGDAADPVAHVAATFMFTKP